MSEPRILTMEDVKSICGVAEDVLDELCLNSRFYCYDDEGNYLSDCLPCECETVNRWIAERRTAPKSWDYVFLPRNEKFRQTTFLEIQEMPPELIQQRYLTDILPKARAILRRGSMYPDVVVSNEVPDSLLDKIFTATWFAKLIWWTGAQEAISQSKGGGAP